MFFVVFNFIDERQSHIILSNSRDFAVVYVAVVAVVDNNVVLLDEVFDVVVIIIIIEKAGRHCLGQMI